MTRIATIIVAGGSGSRCGGGLPKQFRFLGGRPVLARTIDRMAEALPGCEIVVVLPERHLDFWKNLSARFDIAAHAVVAGGAERFHSVRNGLEALHSDPELIAVQDGVRPLVTVETVRRVAAEAGRSRAAIPVVLPVDSFREADGTTSRVIDRSRLRVVQTPQIFRADLLRKAYRAEFDRQFTDDASAVERLGQPIALVEGDRTNLKLTTEEDFTLAEALLALRETTETDDKQL